MAFDIINKSKNSKKAPTSANQVVFLMDLFSAAFFVDVLIDDLLKIITCAIN